MLQSLMCGSQGLIWAAETLMRYGLVLQRVAECCSAVRRVAACCSIVAVFNVWLTMHTCDMIRSKEAGERTKCFICVT